LVEPYLEEAPFEELCDDSLVIGAAPRVDYIDPICTEPLDLAPFHPHHFPLTPLFVMRFMSSYVILAGFTPRLTLIAHT